MGSAKAQLGFLMIRRIKTNIYKIHKSPPGEEIFKIDPSDLFEAFHGAMLKRVVKEFKELTFQTNKD